MKKYYFLLAKRSFIRSLSDYSTYKFNILGEMLMSFIFVLLIFYTSKVFDNSESEFLSSYNNDYFSFLVSGLIVLSFMSKSFSSMPSFVSEAQSLGYIEQIVNSKTSFRAVLINSLLFPLSQALLRIMFIYFFALVFNGTSLNPSDIIEITILLIFTSMPFVGISLAMVSIIMIYKKAAFINSIFLLGCSIFSGIIYPIEVLPSKVQFLSYLFPTTFSVELIRSRVIEGVAYSEMIDTILIICIISLVFFYMGSVALDRSVKLCKRKGILSHY